MPPIDFQNREGSKIGSGGMLSDANAAVERRERLRKLALETIDISKDPYFMKNHLGSFECKLCLTLHLNEGSYLSHTQGKRHQSNIGMRAAMEAKNNNFYAAKAAAALNNESIKKVIKIGKPGYEVCTLIFILLSLSIQQKILITFIIAMDIYRLRSHVI